MYKLICKDLGFNCNFTEHNNDYRILANNFKEHIKISHKQYYPIKEVFGFIFNQNKNLDALDSLENRLSTCEDSCESFRADKWHIGHRNFP